MREHNQVIAAGHGCQLTVTETPGAAARGTFPRGQGPGHLQESVHTSL